MDTLTPNDDDHKREDPYTDRQHTLARALGEPLTQLLDRKQALLLELIVIEGDIYQEVVNRLQAQIGAMVALFDAKLERER